MNIFEKMLGGGKKEVTESILVEKEPETIVVEDPTSKTIEDIRQAKSAIKEMEEDREKLLQKHRNSITELFEMGVQEKKEGDVARSETYNDILNPIEEELQKISSEILETRAGFDLQPNRIEILDTRIQRLEDLKNNEEIAFGKTEDGIVYNAIQKKILGLNKEEPLIAAMEEITKLEQQRYSLVNNSTEIINHSDRMQKIVYLINQLESEKGDIQRG